MTIPHDGPLGVGEFDETHYPGQGSGEPTTEMNGVDIRIPVNWFKRIFLRFRLIGFDNGMPVQDYSESCGGAQTLHTTDGGITAYGFSTGKEALQLLGIAGQQATGNTAISVAAQTFRVGVKSVNDLPDQSTGISDNANAFAFKNGTHQRAFIHGDGSFHNVLGQSDWTAALLCESGNITLHPSSWVKMRWGVNGDATVRGFLNVQSAANPGGWLKIGNLPFIIGGDAGDYCAVVMRLHGLNPQPVGQYQSYGRVGFSEIVIERFDATDGQAHPCAAAIRAGTQIIFSGSLPRS